MKTKLKNVGACAPCCSTIALTMKFGLLPIATKVDMNSAGDHEERPDQRYEADVIARLVQQSFGMPQTEGVIAGRGGGEGNRDAMIIPLPMML